MHTLLYDPSQIPDDLPALSEAWVKLLKIPEGECLRQLLNQIQPHWNSHCHQQAERWAGFQRQADNDRILQRVLHAFPLDSSEALALMSLAEALIRVPDNATGDALISAAIHEQSWSLEQIEDYDLRASASWALAIAGQLVNTHDHPRTLLQKLSQPLVRQAVRFIIEALGEQFIFATSIEDALKRQHDYHPELTRFSFDMLGEAALTEADAARYADQYLHAIEQIAAEQSQENCSVSIKLSALHPRFELIKGDPVQQALLERLLPLVLRARALDVSVTLDAEEVRRHEISLALFSQLLATSELQGWHKLGLAVQAYGRRAFSTLAWLNQQGEQYQTRIPVRLVKGAYWDSEIKAAQQQGLYEYPVWTCKAATDYNYLACARYLCSDQSPWLEGQLASHNSATLASLLNDKCLKPTELQRLHGMAAPLYQSLQQDHPLPCRIYAPIGEQQALLPYLVRRLLENGANSSFLFQLHTHAPRLIQAPDQALLEALGDHCPLSLPKHIYRPNRNNSRGPDWGSLHQLEQLDSQLQSQQLNWQAASIINGQRQDGEHTHNCCSRAHPQRIIGHVQLAERAVIDEAFSSVRHGFHSWQRTPIHERAQVIRALADLLDHHSAELLKLCIHEGGKTIRDAVAELREAIDFCHYYSQLAEEQLQPIPLPATTGETNCLELVGRGVFLCISPWNFPLAIFTGQICAALVSGNTVVAKPASHTPLIATRVVELLFDAGLPEDAIALVIGKSHDMSQILLSHPMLAGVAFTGSSASAEQINRQLAARAGLPLVPLIAETGGINCMIADSSALPEQLIPDVIESAFHSAGQRCSALRVLFVQDSLYPQLLEQLKAALDCQHIGNPRLFSTDIGPVISAAAREQLHAHTEHWRAQGRFLYQAGLPADYPGELYPPTLIRLEHLHELQEEVFGPVLHLISYPADHIDHVLNQIDECPYGLTLGVHSRNRTLINAVSQAQAGNIYINRNQTGAIVAAQPFGGMKLSGTGPKAGGPHYLLRFVQERTISENTSACGGDRDLLMSLRHKKTGST